MLLLNDTPSPHANPQSTGSVLVLALGLRTIFLIPLF
jgi:hypothetical protein